MFRIISSVLVVLALVGYAFFSGAINELSGESSHQPSSDVVVPVSGDDAAMKSMKIE